MGIIPTYYDAHDGITVKELSERWLKGQKAYDGPVLMDVEDLWKYRDYDWSRETSRGGHGLPFYADEKQPWLQGPEKWDKMKEYMAKHGFDERQPIMLTLAKDGTAKISEGNHRLAIARELGIGMLPVKLFFYQKNYQTDDSSRPPMKVEFRQWLETKRIPMGHCFDFAIRKATEIVTDGVIPISDIKIVHAIVQPEWHDRAYVHAWVESMGRCWDSQMEHGEAVSLPIKDFYKHYGVKKETVKKYSYKEAVKLLTTSGHYGPWHLDDPTST